VKKPLNDFFKSLIFFLLRSTARQLEEGVAKKQLELASVRESMEKERATWEEEKLRAKEEIKYEQHLCDDVMMTKYGIFVGELRQNESF
jgi:hypothetical protein